MRSSINFKRPKLKFKSGVKWTEMLKWSVLWLTPKLSTMLIHRRKLNKKTTQKKICLLNISLRLMLIKVLTHLWSLLKGRKLLASRKWCNWTSKKNISWGRGKKQYSIRRKEMVQESLLSLAIWWAWWVWESGHWHVRSSINFKRQVYVL